MRKTLAVKALHVDLYQLLKLGIKPLIKGCIEWLSMYAFIRLYVPFYNTQEMGLQEARRPNVKN